MADASGKTAPGGKKPRTRRRASKPSVPPEASRPPRAKRTRRAPRPTPAAEKAHRRRTIAFGLGALAGTLLVAAIGLYVGYGRSGRKAPGPAVEIDWPAGLGADEAAELLAEHGVVKSASTLALFFRATGGTRQFVAGPHVLFEGEKPWDIRRSLERSDKRPMVHFTIPEGFHRFDVATRLERVHVAGRRAFLAASADPALLDALGIERAGSVGAESAEGYLFPATYDLPLDSDPRLVVRRLVAESDKRWAALLAAHEDGFASLRASLGFGRREVLTLASIVEKEAVVDEERPVIASVFLNRLLDPAFKSHRLQSDPTAMYGCVAAPDEAPSCAGYSGKATPAINNDPKNRYSTYTHSKLPPGPIANPGAKSIEAVLAPAATRFLFFVAAGRGRHTFSETLDAHNEAVRKRAASLP